MFITMLHVWYTVFRTLFSWFIDLSRLHLNPCINVLLFLTLNAKFFSNNHFAFSTFTVGSPSIASATSNSHFIHRLLVGRGILTSCLTQQLCGQSHSLDLTSIDGGNYMDEGKLAVTFLLTFRLHFESVCDSSLWLACLFSFSRM